jgi:hypothetical protein
MRRASVKETIAILRAVVDGEHEGMDCGCLPAHYPRELVDELHASMKGLVAVMPIEEAATIFVFNVEDPKCTTCETERYY